MENLLDVQLQIEQDSYAAGIERYRKEMVARGEDSTPPGRRIIGAAVGKLAAAIEEWCKEALDGAASRSAGVVYRIAEFDAQELAYITIRSVITSMRVTDKSLTTLAEQLAIRAEALATHEQIAKEAPGLFRRMQRMLASNSEDYAVVAIRRAAKWSDVKAIKWGKSERIRFGSVLLELAQKHTGLFTIESRKTGKFYQFVVVPDAGTVEWLRQAHANAETLHPFYPPMVVAPRDWKSTREGGYYSKALSLPLVKHVRKRVLRELEENLPTTALAAINAVQRTAWAINTSVLAVLEESWRIDRGIGGLPHREKLPLPPKAFPEDVAADDPRLLAWKVEAAKVHGHNARSLSRRVSVQMCLNTAREYAKYPAMYFVHQLDFRGRLYPVSTFLSPHGDDVSRGLLRFSERKPLGESGAYWLAVHAANSYGIDKVSFDERVQWVQEHQQDIIALVRDPFGAGAAFWKEADAPWQFLAAAFEWAALVAHVSAGGVQEEFASCIPVGLDGSCNGLQNFAAMLRDEVAGAQVGLVPSTKPSDVYTSVSRESARLMLAEGGPLSQRWAPIMLSKDGRKLSKRNTMTVPYSVSAYGMRDQVLSELVGFEGKFGEVSFEDARYIADKNGEAISTIVRSARQAMGFLTQCAKIAAKVSKPISWRTPMGMTVYQGYERLTESDVNLSVFGRRVRLRVLTGVEGTIDGRKQALAVAPNVVHSLDASHLMATVTMCMNDTLSAYAMVHDSFGTHACDVETLANRLREAFVWQYGQHDVLQQFRDALAVQLPPEVAAELPPVPAKGRLDLDDVLRSDYFFA